MRTRIRVSSRLCFVVMWVFSVPAFAQVDDDEFRPGLHAKYVAGGKTVERIDPVVAFDWGTTAPLDQGSRATG